VKKKQKAKVAMPPPRYQELPDFADAVVVVYERRSKNRPQCAA